MTSSASFTGPTRWSQPGKFSSKPELEREEGGDLREGGGSVSCKISVPVQPCSSAKVSLPPYCEAAGPGRSIPPNPPPDFRIARLVPISTPPPPTTHPVGCQPNRRQLTINCHWLTANSHRLSANH